jgi:hypothetical protein
LREQLLLKFLRRHLRFADDAGQPIDFLRQPGELLTVADEQMGQVGLGVDRHGEAPLSFQHRTGAGVRQPGRRENRNGRRQGP